MAKRKTKAKKIEEETPKSYADGGRYAPGTALMTDCGVAVVVNNRNSLTTDANNYPDDLWVIDSAMESNNPGRTFHSDIPDRIPVFGDANNIAGISGAFQRHGNQRLDVLRYATHEEALAFSKKFPKLPVTIPSAKIIIDDPYEDAEFNPFPIQVKDEWETASGKIVTIVDKQVADEFLGTCDELISGRGVWNPDGTVYLPESWSNRSGITATDMRLIVLKSREFATPISTNPMLIKRITRDVPQPKPGELWQCANGAVIRLFKKKFKGAITLRGEEVTDHPLHSGEFGCAGWKDDGQPATNANPAKKALVRRVEEGMVMDFGDLSLSAKDHHRLEKWYREAIKG